MFVRANMQLLEEGEFGQCPQHEVTKGDGRASARWKPVCTESDSRGKTRSLSRRDSKLLLLTRNFLPS